MISNLSKAYLKRTKRLNAQNVILLIFLRMEKIVTERKDLYAKVAERILILQPAHCSFHRK